MQAGRIHGYYGTVELDKKSHRFQTIWMPEEKENKNTFLLMKKKLCLFAHIKVSNLFLIR